MKLLDLSHEILLEVITHLPDFRSLSSLQLTHPVFGQISRAYSSVVTTSIASRVFGGGQQQLQCVSNLLQISRNGFYAKPSSTTPGQPITFEPKDIPLLFLIRQSLDIALRSYVRENNRSRRSWVYSSLAGFWMRNLPRSINGNDTRFILLIERCFLRFYAATVLIYCCLNYDRLYYLPEVRACLNKEILSGFFSTIPQNELQKTRTCLNRLTPEQTGIYNFMYFIPRLRVIVLLSNVEAIFTSDYDFVEAGKS